MSSAPTCNAKLSCVHEYTLGFAARESLRWALQQRDWNRVQVSGSMAEGAIAQHLSQVYYRSMRKASPELIVPGLLTNPLPAARVRMSHTAFSARFALETPGRSTGTVDVELESTGSRILRKNLIARVMWQKCHHCNIQNVVLEINV